MQLEQTGDPAVVLHRMLNNYTTTAIDITDLLLKLGALETLKKNDIVFRENRFNGFEYFQLSGVSHRYNEGERRQPLTTGIYQNESVITPHFARTPNGESLFSLQALTDCVYLRVPAGAFHDLREENPIVKAFGRAVVEREFIQNLRFEVFFRAGSAKDRLKFLREYYPGLENVIPHTVIASFLGITPVSFSRLRSEITDD